jgi:hypothetical protein
MNKAGNFVELWQKYGFSRARRSNYKHRRTRGFVCNLSSAKGNDCMKRALTLAALALAALLFAVPANTQASPLKLDGLHQDSLVQTVAGTKKKKKKVVKKKKKKKYAKKAGKKKKAMKKKRKPAKKKM